LKLALVGCDPRGAIDTSTPVTDMSEEQDETPEKKPGGFYTFMLKVLMLIVFLLLLGMCSIKYIS
jgi:hypothetical protein